LEVDDIETIMEMLTGERLPDGVTMTHPPKLDRETAFGIVWFLQEITSVIPDNFEMCANCGAIYDTRHGGATTSAFEYEGGWYQDAGITLEEVRAHEEENFCDPQCELMALTRPLT
jgi:hypothetical protein